LDEIKSKVWPDSWFSKAQSKSRSDQNGSKKIFSKLCYLIRVEHKKLELGQITLFVMGFQNNNRRRRFGKIDSLP
jgi:hypothetical protein